MLWQVSVSYTHLMQKRKDHKGRVLKDGETYRKNDGLYMYRWTGGDKKRHTVYCSTLEGLREKEKEIQNDLRDGIQQGSSNITLNDVYKMWKNDKVGIEPVPSQVGQRSFPVL